MARQDSYSRYTIRVPSDLYERVKIAAGDKSINAQVIEILEEKYPAPAASEHEQYAQVVKWSDRVLLSTSEEEAKRLANEANEWLKGPGQSDYRIILSKPPDFGRWLPCIVHKDIIRADGMFSACIGIGGSGK